jgi:hypothetical protein
MLFKSTLVVARALLMIAILGPSAAYVQPLFSVWSPDSGLLSPHNYE